MFGDSVCAPHQLSGTNNTPECSVALNVVWFSYWELIQCD
uniref:Uncharacterized protein n=1 Tax=Arundo donax TaxID=35708 RepID=A0A0A8ZU17_ARUDO